MAKNRPLPGWWRTGKLWLRLLCLGATLGAGGALGYFLSFVWGRPFTPYALVWGLVRSSL